MREKNTYLQSCFAMIFLLVALLIAACEETYEPPEGQIGILLISAGMDEEYSPDGLPNYFAHLYPYFPVGFYAGGEIEGNDCYTLIHHADEAEAATCDVEIGTPIDVFCDEYENLNTPYQATYAESLWLEMQAHSATSGGVCIGGSIMGYCDEWWKGKYGSASPCSDPCGCPDDCSETIQYRIS